MRNTVLAVDFGTSNSLVGAWADGKRIEALQLDLLASDPTVMRTLLYFPNADECFYGVEAIKQYLEREMEGRLFRSFKSHLPNRMYLGTSVGDRILTLENMVGIFLLELKKRAENILQRDIDSVILGRPARYSLDAVNDGFALHRMQKAAEYARFKNIEFMPEPLAAALDYRRKLTSEKIVLIGDFGGGTSDFTVIKLGPFQFQREHVLGLDGCSLAGDALDSLFMSQKLGTYFGAKAKYRMPLGNNWLTMPPSISDRLNFPAQIVHLKEPTTYQYIQEVKKCAPQGADHKALERLTVLIDDQQIFPFFETIESTKRSLSDNEKSHFSFYYPGLEINSEFNRGDFETWAEAFKGKIFASLDRCLQQAQVSAEQVDLVCLTGGTAKVPLVLNEFERRFGKQKLQTQSHFHSVLSGLIEAAELYGKGLLPN